MTGGNPFLINVVELRRLVGTQKTVSEVVPVADLALSGVRVNVGSSLTIELLLEAVSGGISADGSIRGEWNGDCRRCLEPVLGLLEVEVAEVFENKPTEGETYPISDDSIDLEPMVRELALLALPINPLCASDCKGPLPDTFPVSVDAEEDNPPAKDPRWAALDELRE